jgi:hypothetical protein
MEHAKESLKGVPVVAPTPKPVKEARRQWFAWLSPAFAVPAMALMLGVLAFQNLIQLPVMHQELVAMNAPAVLPSADLKSGSSRGEENVVFAKAGEFFQLTIDIPDTSKAAHTAELYDASGRKLWSLPVPAEAPKDGLALKMPGNLPAGSYLLVVKPAENPGSSEAAHYPFLLRRN